MGWGENLFTLLLVVSGGQGQGLFVYNGQPGPGNPPVLAIVAPGTTSDPFGNPASAVLNVGNVSGAHFGVNASGDIFLVASSGVVIFHGRSSDGAFFWYNASGEGVGNLVLSVAPTAGTDPPGNPYKAGFHFHGANNSGIIMTLAAGVPFQIFATGVTEELVAANIQALINNPGVSETMNLLIVGPQGIAPFKDLAGMSLASAAKDGTVPATAGGALTYTDTAGTVHQPLVWGVNGTKAFSALAGDSNTYQVERITNQPGGALVVNQTTFTQQVLPTLVIGVGTYRYRAQVVFVPSAAAGQLKLEFAGSVTAGMRIEFSVIAQAGPFNPGGAGEVTALVSPFTDTVPGSTANRVCTIDGTLTATVAGTFAMFAATSIAADTFTIRQAGTYQELTPMGPP